ncbi:MAG: hypothetical protein IIB95_09175 [Candidatus Marinimicrobia bacterium]|nr:hypothetical protein [Candidatus Neomarinimicrobiota bacterium]MCH7763899.1 hypothetical protein [Candidatus Neomarinimicrobiota bacterium]
MTLNIIIQIVSFTSAVFGGYFVVKAGMNQFIDKTLPQGFPSAGKYIGLLERALFWACFSMNQVTLVGFILTIKAIYRFGDIQGDNNQKMRLSEYFIIGTLYSLGWTILNWVAMEKFLC